MLKFIARRVIMMIPILFAVSIVAFIIIQLPPGDFLTSYVASFGGDEGSMEGVGQGELDAIREAYGLDDPFFVQYFKWIFKVLQGDFGMSMRWRKPVSDILAERIPYSFAISITSFVIVWIMGIFIGTYSATHQYSVGDYVATFIGFMGIATPNFLLALIFLWLNFSINGTAATGLFSPEYQLAPWSIGKVLDLLSHMVIPAILVGTAGAAGMIKMIRANMLDELQKPYMMVARSKGLRWRYILLRYPFRIAINPAISTVGYILPRLISGELLVSMVLGLPTVAPLFVDALKTQDMFLAGSVVLILSFLTIVGTLFSDILLAWVDPRIRETF